MSLVWVSWRLISAIECDSSSAATAAVSTLAEASLKACTAPSARCEVWSEEPNSAPAVERIAVALSLTLRQQRFHQRPERGDRGVDRGAALFVVADGGALLLGAALLGDVLVGGDPAAARQRLVLGEHDAAVARLHVMRRALAFADAVQDVLAIGIDVAGEQAGFLAVLDQVRAACSRASRSRGDSLYMSR